MTGHARSTTQRSQVRMAVLGLQRPLAPCCSLGGLRGLGLWLSMGVRGFWRGDTGFKIQDSRVLNGHLALGGRIFCPPISHFARRLTINRCASESLAWYKKAHRSKWRTSRSGTWTKEATGGQTSWAAAAREAIGHTTRIEKGSLLRTRKAARGICAARTSERVGVWISGPPITA
jgi:hypothetical protein